MWISPGPEAELDSLLVAFVGVVDQGDVQLLLDGWIVLTMALRESEEWFVAGVIRKRLCHRVSCGKIDAHPTEPLLQLRIVRIEEIAEAEPVNVGALFEEHIKEIPPPRAKGAIQGAGRFNVEVVPVVQQKQDHGVVPVFECDLKGRRQAPPFVSV